MEENKVQEFMMTINERMTRFEERQEQTRADVSDLKTTVKSISEAVGNVKSLEEYIKWNKQTWSRPLTIALIVALIGFAGVVVSLNYKSNSVLDKTAQSMMDVAATLKQVIPCPTP